MPIVGPDSDRIDDVQKQLNTVHDILEASHSWKWRTLAIIVAAATVVGTAAAIIAAVYQALLYYNE